MSIQQPFEDVRVAEARQLKELAGNVDRLQRQINFGQRALSLKGAAGYDDFMKSIEALRDATTRELVSSVATDSYLRVIQGKTQALGDILAIMRRGEAMVSQLAEQLEAAQNALLEARRRMPRQPLPEKQA